MRRVRISVRRCAVVATIVAALSFATQAAAPSFLWKATGPRGGTVYLAGSIHLLSKEYYPLAPAFGDALDQSDLFVAELDLGDMLSTESQMKMLSRGMMPAGQSLESVLSPQTMTDVRAKVSELGLPLAPLQLFKPWALALTLQGLEWQKAGFAADLGLDRHFYDRAKAANKEVQGLETLDYQIARFDDMPMEMQDRMLSETLKEMATTKQNVEKLAQAWKAGDVAAIESVVLSDLKSEPAMYDRLLVQRNRNWLPKIEALFARSSPAFVVVGAAHLVGSDGLIQMLKARGYSVTQL